MSSLTSLSFGENDYNPPTYTSFFCSTLKENINLPSSSKADLKSSCKTVWSLFVECGSFVFFFFWCFFHKDQQTAKKAPESEEKPDSFGHGDHAQPALCIGRGAKAWTEETVDCLNSLFSSGITR